jgi:site-specific recombinase XerD
MRLPVTFYPGTGPNHVYLASYKEWLTKQSVTSNTLRAYHSRVKQFLLFLEYANLSEQSSDGNSMNEAMSLYLDFLKESKKSDKVTVNANVNALNNFSQFLGLKDTQLKREQCYSKPTKGLTLEEQERFLNSIERQQSARDKALALVLLSTGLRIGDCARLNVSDIAAGFASITLANGASVPLNKDAKLAVRNWLEERQTLADVAAESALWLTKQGQRISISGIAFVIKRIAWQANLVLCAEVLRRTWLTNATDRLNKNELASRFGGYVSVAAIKRHSVSLPFESSASALEH